jgi:hypothetical protein
LRYHMIRQYIDQGLIDLKFIEGSNNPADMLTKNLPRESFLKCRSQLGLTFSDAAISN